MSLRDALILTLVVSLACETLAAEEDDVARTPTNLELIQNLSAQVGDTLATLAAEGDSVRVAIYPSESAWFVEGSVLEAIRKSGRIPTASTSAPYDIQLGLEKVEVRYDDGRRSGLFGSRIVDRSVGVRYAVKVVDRRSGMILLTGTVSRDSHDVVESSEIEELENPRIPATQGKLPAEGFFSSLVEPLVTMGAIAVAVYLLFQVRS